MGTSHGFSRRTFMAGALASATAIAAAPRAHGAVKMTMNLSCGRVGIGASQEEALELAVRNGFDSIDPDVGFLSKLTDEALADFRARMAKKNIVWAAGGVPVEFRKDEKAFVDSMKGVADYAATLQRAGVTRAGTWLMPGSNEHTHRAFGKMHAERLRAIADVFGEHGLFMGLEYVGPKTMWSSFRFPWVHTMVETAELLEDIGRPNVGYILDSWHWYHAQESGDDIRSLKASQIAAVDLNDAPAGVERDAMPDTVRELPCATGVIPLKEFMTALADIGYDGPVRAEPFNADLNALDSEAAAQKTAEAMRAAWAYLPA